VRFLDISEAIRDGLARIMAQRQEGVGARETTAA
jgi:hypothetical protein